MKQVLLIFTLTQSFNFGFCQLQQVNKPVGNNKIYTDGNPPLPFPEAYNITPLNLIRSRNILAPITDIQDIDHQPLGNVKEQTVFIDGLGRTLQTVMKKASPLMDGDVTEDIIIPNRYDDLGRGTYQYLPYSDHNASGEFRPNPFPDQFDYNNRKFKGEGFMYGKTIFENSPLKRKTGAMAPGYAWTGSDRGVRVSYSFNTKDDRVAHWFESSIDPDIYKYRLMTLPTKGMYYQEGILFKTSTSDENGNTSVEFTDGNGNTVLKRVLLNDPSSLNNSEPELNWLDTYYIYDQLGRLSAVIPPKASRWVMQNQQPLEYEMANELCFLYGYNAAGLLTAKKVPGQSWTRMIYDKRNRLVFIQDDVLKKQGRYLAILYDLLNRPVINALLEKSDSYEVQKLQDYVNTHTGLDTQTSFENGLINVSDNPIPDGMPLVTLRVNFFDDYRFTRKRFNPDYNPMLDSGNNVNAETLIEDGSTLTRDMLTGKMTRILPENLDYGRGRMMTSVNFYDEKGRIVQSNAENHTNGESISTSLYDFSGKAICNLLVINNPQCASVPVMKVKTNYEYDHTGQIREIYKTINDDQAKHLVVKYAYDETGKLTRKEFGTNPSIPNEPLEVQELTYNIRGWLKGINGDYASNPKPMNNRWFGSEISYDLGFQKNQYNGNIAGICWKSRGDEVFRAYGFDYDRMNRLSYADFSQLNDDIYTDDPMVNFDVEIGVLDNNWNRQIDYDENGNILSMKQWGLQGNSSRVIDQLNFHYYDFSNRLKNVVDNMNDPRTRLGDFRSSETYTDEFQGGPKPSDAEDYTYDWNGNLQTDRNKDIRRSIQYNYLNLSVNIPVNGKGNISYLYDADGNKLRKTVEENGQSRITDFVNGFQYQNNELIFLGHEEGRIRYKTANGGSFVYDYFLKDHLGNVRMVLTEEQQQDIYPVATLEGNGNNEDPLVVEKQYYDINDAYIVTKQMAGRSNELDYENNNGNPPINNNPNCNDQSPIAQTATSEKMYRLNGEVNKTGLGITLKVMSGDRLDIFGKSYYSSPNQNNSSSSTMPAAELLDGFLHSPGNPASGKVSISDLTDNPYNPLNNLLNFLSDPGRDDQQGTGTPKAAINWILLDEQFRFVKGGYSAVGEPDRLKNHYNDLSMQNIDINKNGYIYVYVSNESALDVFFDNLQLIHTRGPLLEETHYYPFGLIMAGISSKAAGEKENKCLFNSKELQSKEFADGSGLEVYDYGARNYDVQIGHFLAPDALSDSYFNWSPFSYSFNNPIRFVDPSGLAPEDWVMKNNGDGTRSPIWDDRVTDQITAEKYYGQDATYLGKEKQYTTADGREINLNTDKTSTDVTDYNKQITNGELNSGDILQNRIPELERGNLIDVDGIILHRTESSTTNATLNAFKNGRDGVNYGTHFLVGKDGEILQTANLEKFTLHVGKTRSAEFPNNKNSIGIEVVGKYDYINKTWESLSSEQISSVTNLANYLMVTYKLPSSSLYCHENISYKTAGEGTIVLNAIKAGLLKK